MSSMHYIDELDIAEKHLFIRADLNIKLGEGGEIIEDSRLREVLPTIQYALKEGASVILASHLGRPQGEVHEELRMTPIGERLAEFLDHDIILPEDCIGDAVKKLATEMKGGQLMLLENLRFHPEEELNNPNFAKQLATLADIYINDAFGSMHRAHASVVGMVPHFKEKGAGFLVKKELQYLRPLLEKPERPFVALLGGAKVSDKIGVVESLISHVDAIGIGGGMALTFLAAQGIPIGSSKIEEEKIHLARKTLHRAAAKGIPFLLPLDHVAAKEISEDAKAIHIPSREIPDGLMGLDIGERTVKKFRDLLEKAKTVFWNGPMGVFEIPAFAEGTKGVAKAVSECGATSIVGGGDSMAAIRQAGMERKISHLSTGGGAALEFIEGKDLPGLVALQE